MPGWSGEIVAAMTGGTLTVPAEGVPGAALVRHGATLAYAVPCPGGIGLTAAEAARMAPI